VSWGSLLPSRTVDKFDWAEVSTFTFHNVIAPVGPVANANEKSTEGVRFVNVCMPSENVKAVGDTLVRAMFGASGPANVTVPDTKLLVV